MIDEKLLVEWEKTWTEDEYIDVEAIPALIAEVRRLQGQLTEISVFTSEALDRVGEDDMVAWVEEIAKVLDFNLDAESK